MAPVGDAGSGRAVEAAMASAAALGLVVESAVVLHDSNKLTVHLLPCDVVARVARGGAGPAQAELDLARLLVAAACPVAAVAPGVAPVVHERGGFAVTLWTHYRGSAPGPDDAGDYARALEQLHAGMRRLDVAAPHMSARVAEARHLVASPARTPDLDDEGRALLARALDEGCRAVTGHGAGEQLLHGEPHPGNVLRTGSGMVFVDLETCCRGPVEFDVAHAPAAVGARYRGADPALLDQCRALILAMVTAWRWDRDDRLPNGRRAARELLAALRRGPPWPELDAIVRDAPDGGE